MVRRWVAAVLGVAAVAATSGCRDETPASDDPGSGPITARVIARLPRGLPVPGDSPSRAAAAWDPSGVLVYRTRVGYSGSCPPTASAHLSGGQRVTIEVTDYHGSGACTADARAYWVVLRGVASQPRGVLAQEGARHYRVSVTLGVG